MKRKTNDFQQITAKMQRFIKKFTAPNTQNGSDAIWIP